MKYVGLLRGINVGGKNRLPMAELREALETTGLENIRTHLQSGNLIFDSNLKSSNAIEKRIEKAIGKSHGFTPRAFVLPLTELSKAIEANPFPKAEKDPRSLHLYFLEKELSRFDDGELRELAAESEKFELRGRVFYLHAPDGIGRSKLAAKAERALGVAATARNWRTVSKLMEMASEDS